MGPENEKAEQEICCLEEAKTGNALLLLKRMTNLTPRTGAITCSSALLFLT